MHNEFMEKSMLNVLENLCCWTDTLLGRRNGCCGPGALMGAPPAERGSVRWIYLCQVNKDGEGKVVF